jgi:hypothetical protein
MRAQIEQGGSVRAEPCPRPERMNSPLENREVRLRGLVEADRCLSCGVLQTH